MIVATPRSVSRSTRNPSYSLTSRLSQHAPEDLPRRALRQLGDEAVLARALEAGERVGGEAVRVELVRGHALVGDDVGDDALAPAVVGRADDRDLAHARRAREHVLDLDRMDVLAARDDHVVDAADDPEVAVLVEPADVARVVPAVADRLRVRVRPVPVAGERLVGAHVAEDLALARRVEPQAGVQRRAPRAAGLRALVALDRERVDLGRAVVVDEDLGLEGGGDLLDERARHRRARVGDGTDGGRVEVPEARVVDEVVEEGRREVERVDALPLDQPQRLLGIPRGCATKQPPTSEAASSEWMPIVW